MQRHTLCAPGCICGHLSTRNPTANLFCARADKTAPASGSSAQPGALACGWRRPGATSEQRVAVRRRREQSRGHTACPGATENDAPLPPMGRNGRAGDSRQSKGGHDKIDQEHPWKIRDDRQCTEPCCAQPRLESPHCPDLRRVVHCVDHLTGLATSSTFPGASGARFQLDLGPQSRRSAVARRPDRGQSHNPLTNPRPMPLEPMIA